MNNDNLSELVKTFKQFKPAKGKMLDNIGNLYGLKRKRILFFIPIESDNRYKKRLLNFHNNNKVSWIIQ